MSALTGSVESRSAASGSRSRRLLRSPDLRTAVLFLIPATIGLVVFYIVPAIRGFYFSFTNYSVLQEPTWVGTANYSRLVADPLFWNALWVTLYYVVLNIGFQTIIALGLAVLMHRLTQSWLLRGVVVLPDLCVL